jgi:hypothetical protein
MANRSSNATLSPTEFASLRRVANGLVNTVPREHKDTLFAMELVQYAGLDGVVLSDIGWRRLEREDPKAWRQVPARHRRVQPVRMLAHTPRGDVQTL